MITWFEVFRNLCQDGSGATLVKILAYISTIRLSSSNSWINESNIQIVQINLPKLPWSLTSCVTFGHDSLQGLQGLAGHHHNQLTICDFTKELPQSKQFYYHTLSNLNETNLISKVIICQIWYYLNNLQVTIWKAKIPNSYLICTLLTILPSLGSGWVPVIQHTHTQFSVHQQKWLTGKLMESTAGLTLLLQSIYWFTRLSRVSTQQI